MRNHTPCEAKGGGVKVGLDREAIFRHMVKRKSSVVDAMPAPSTDESESPTDSKHVTKALSILALTSEVPWPLNSGGHLRSYHMLRALGKRFRPRPGLVLSPALSPSSWGRWALDVAPLVQHTALHSGFSTEDLATPTARALAPSMTTSNPLHGQAPGDQGEADDRHGQAKGDSEGHESPPWRRPDGGQPGNSDGSP